MNTDQPKNQVLNIIVRGKTYTGANAFGHHGFITIYDKDGNAVVQVATKDITYIGIEAE